MNMKVVHYRFVYSYQSAIKINHTAEADFSYGLQSKLLGNFIKRAI